MTHFNEGEKEERERENGRRKRKEKVVERERERGVSLSPFPQKPLSSFLQNVLVAHCATLRRLSLFLQRGAFLVFAPHPPGGSQQQIANSFVFAPSNRSLWGFCASDNAIDNRQASYLATIATPHKVRHRPKERNKLDFCFAILWSAGLDTTCSTQTRGRWGQLFRPLSDRKMIRSQFQSISTGIRPKDDDDVDCAEKGMIRSQSSHWRLLIRDPHFLAPNSQSLLESIG